MSKSVGNIFQLSEALDRFGAEAVVAYLISGHYRQPLEFSEEALARGGGAGRADPQLPAGRRRPEGGEDPFVAERREAFLDALADDFNTPRAWAALFELVAEGNRTAAARRPRRRSPSCCRCSGSSRCSSRRTRPPTPRPRRCSPSASAPARERDFERADGIRDELAALGLEVRDTPDGAAARGARR